MIQTTLSFILGFLCAAFLAVLVAPAIWRRAVALTRRRVEASLPLTMEQIQAGRDSLRAEHAMAARKLEMTIASLKEKAAGQAVEIGRIRDELASAREDGRRKREEIGAQEARIAGLEAALAEEREENARRAEDLAAAHALAAERAREIETLSRLHDEVSFSASSRQIEIVAQEARLDQLSADLSAVRSERREAEARARESAAEAKQVRDALTGERKKVSALEAKVEKLIASLAERDEKIERREREVQRLKERAKGSSTTARADTAADETRLRERLEVLTRENRKLREDRGQGAEAPDAALLREQIGQLAAEVVHLTAALEGPQSPIHQALAEDAGEGGGLAERIRALQEASAAR